MVDLALLVKAAIGSTRTTLPREAFTSLNGTRILASVAELALPEPEPLPRGQGLELG